MRIWIVTIAILAVSACTTVPEQIQGTYPDISPARIEPAVFGSTVRWGMITPGAPAAQAGETIRLEQHGRRVR